MVGNGGNQGFRKGKAKKGKKQNHQNHLQTASMMSSQRNLGKEYLSDFFAQYQHFQYDRTASSTAEFYRMCDSFGWEREDEERREAHELFKTALVQQFNGEYGTDVEDIESWRGLSRALDIVPPPANVGEAKEIFRGKFVNLVDLVDVHSTGRPVTQFRSLDELKNYTTATGKYFPKESAYAGGVLKFLLREIFNSYQGRNLGEKRR